MGDTSGTYVQPSPPSPPNLVGVFLRAKRESVGLSQRALGQLFEPAVTTQFISNIERGVTPLPPVHIPTLVRVLRVQEEELLGVLEREYAAKITHRFGRSDSPGLAASHSAVRTSEADQVYFQAIYNAFRVLDPSTRDAFVSLCETILKVPKPNLPKPG